MDTLKSTTLTELIRIKKAELNLLKKEINKCLKDSSEPKFKLADLLQRQEAAFNSLSKLRLNKKLLKKE